MLVLNQHGGQPMTQGLHLSSRDTLGTAEKKFELWRRNRSGGDRIPEALWQAAVEAAEEHGPSKTAKALRLDYYKLKARLGLPTKKQEGPKDRGFLEVPLFASTTGESVLELEDREGARLRVVLKGTKTAELESLARAFWDMAR